VTGDRALEPAQLAEHEREVVPARLREVVELVLVDVHAAGRDLVQQRLPQVGAIAVHQRDLRLAVAVAIPQRGGELEAAGSPAHDDDAMGHGLQAPREGRRSRLKPLRAAA
jgi:hypothetical protein